MKVNEMSAVFGWHFTGNKLRDGRELPAVGVPLTHEDRVEIRRSGLHGSKRILDALLFARGPNVSRCRFERIEDEDETKIVCRERTVLWRLDATDLLWEDARQSALSVVHLCDVPDVVRRFLEGDDELRDAARNAAWGDHWITARNAAWVAALAHDGLTSAWVAAMVAARDATYSEASAAIKADPSVAAAPWDVARDVPRGGASNAARDAARSTIWSAEGNIAGSDAWIAKKITYNDAWVAARGAARDVASARLAASVTAEAKRLGIYVEDN